MKGTFLGSCRESVLDLRGLPFEHRWRGSGLADRDGTIHERWAPFQQAFPLQSFPSRSCYVRYYPPHVLFAHTASALVRILLLRFLRDTFWIRASHFVDISFAYM